MSANIVSCITTVSDLPARSQNLLKMHDYQEFMGGIGALTVAARRFGPDFAIPA
jgi:hypothetical protein